MVMHIMKTKINTRTLTSLAIMSAAAFVISIFRFYFIPSATYLTYDLKDIILIIGGFIYGPLAVFAMSIPVAFFEMIFMPNANGIYGMIMNIVSTCAFACTASFIYKKMKTVTGATIGLACGALTVTVVMMIWNYILTPIYLVNYAGFFNTVENARSFTLSIMFSVFLPFNLIKSSLNAALIMFLYKPLKKALSASKLLPSENIEVKSKINIGVIIASTFVVITCILSMFALSGKI